MRWSWGKNAPRAASRGGGADRGRLDQRIIRQCRSRNFCRFDIATALAELHIVAKVSRDGGFVNRIFSDFFCQYAAGDYEGDEEGADAIDGQGLAPAQVKDGEYEQGD